MKRKQGTTMNFKSKFVGIVGAAFMTVGMIGGAYAETTADVNVKVGAPSNATLAASITGGRFADVTYRAGNSFQNSNGNIVVTATDTRGVGSGWTVTLSSNGDFKDGNKGFAVSNFSLQSGSVQGRDNANANGITPAAVGAVGGSQSVMVASSGSGMGVFDDTVQGTIKVPDGTLVGDYKTTLTVAITAGN
ncbi:hypothetical protein BH09CHL1_BH09CHL1_00860 [soil metagenome]